MEENQIVLEVNLDVEDLYLFQKETFYRKLAPKFLTVISILFFFAAIGSILAKPPLGIAPPELTIFFIIFPISFLIIFPWLLKKGAIRAFDTSKFLHKKQKYQIGSEGIEVSSNSGKAFLKWNEFYRANESKNGFRFFISNRQVYLIPKRYYEGNEESYQQLKRYVKKVQIPKGEKKFFKKALGFGCFGCLIYLLIFLAVFIVAWRYQS